MIVRKLTLENIRSHSKLELEFGEGVTVITGRTGSGKSTILMAMEYALFGGETGINYNSLLRRGASRGIVKLEFSHEEEDYEITRSLKRSNKNISFDKDNMTIMVNNKRIPVIERLKDFDEKIKQLLHTDSNMFGVMSYTRQDEIRKLIELKNEERQEYIDEILQLSKYKLAWNNLKEVITHFNNEMIELKAKITFKKEIQEEITRLEKEKEENETEALRIRNQTKELSENLEKTRAEYLRSVELKNKIEELFEKNVEEKKKNEILKDQIQKITREITDLRSKIIIMPEPGIIRENLEKIREKLYSHTTTRTILEKDYLKTKGITTGICPTCKQEVSSEHLTIVKNEILKRIETTGNEIEKLEDKAEKEQEKLDKSLKNDDVKKRINSLEEELRTLETKNLRVQTYKDYSIELAKSRRQYEGALEEFKETRAEHDSKKQLLQHLESNHEKLFANLHEKKEKLGELEEHEKKLARTIKNLELVSRLREDVRSIREAVRDNFLEQFRNEFQKRFEEIRRNEDEYTVDVLNTYEPVAYSVNGDETQITSLSGGEKTSVALSYRIALSNIASELADVSQSELLILDEPTLGFDSEDVKALPEILEKIRIKQIIIVTHEEELKNAANTHYEVEKKNGKSSVT